MIRRHFVQGFGFALTFFAMVVPLVANAVIVCGPGGCGDIVPQNTFVTNVVPTLIKVLVTVSAGMAVIFVIYGGIQMVTMYGDEGGVAKGKKSVIYGLGGLGVTMMAGTLVAMFANSNWGGNSANLIMNFMKSAAVFMVTIFNGLFGVAIFYGAIRMAISGGKSDEFNKGVSMIKWSIVGALLVNFSRAIVQAFIGLGF